MLPARPDDPFVRELEVAGIDCRPARPAGDIRVNLTLTEPDGTTTKLNGPGAPVDAAHLDDLAETLVRSAAGGAWTVLAGSLPPDAPSGYYADLVARLRGVSRVAVDTSEGPLAALVDELPGSASRPAEAERRGARVGDRHRRRPSSRPTPRWPRRPPARSSTAASARCWRRSGRAAPYWSTPTARGTPRLHRPVVVSTVGAGDCTLFGYLLAEQRGLSAPDRLALAVAYGSAAAGLPGTTIPGPDDLHPERVDVQQLD